jgi:hypothetical protein
MAWAPEFLNARRSSSLHQDCRCSAALSIPPPISFEPPACTAATIRRVGLAEAVFAEGDFLSAVTPHAVDRGSMGREVRRSPNHNQPSEAPAHHVDYVSPHLGPPSTFAAPMALPQREGVLLSRSPRRSSSTWFSVGDREQSLAELDRGGPRHVEQPPRFAVIPRIGVVGQRDEATDHQH